MFPVEHQFLLSLKMCPCLIKVMCLSAKPVNSKLDCTPNSRAEFAENELGWIPCIPEELRCLPQRNIKVTLHFNNLKKVPASVSSCRLMTVNIDMAFVFEPLLDFETPSPCLNKPLALCTILELAAIRSTFCLRSKYHVQMRDYSMIFEMPTIKKCSTESQS